MENEESTSVIGNSAAPYINGLANSYGLATQYYAVSHPSLPNYLALSAGSTFGISSDCTTCWVNSSNLADQIEASGRSWKAYMEGLPSACFVGDAYPYMQKHDPWIYYNDILTNAAACCARSRTPGTCRGWAAPAAPARRRCANTSADLNQNAPGRPGPFRSGAAGRSRPGKPRSPSRYRSNR